MKNLNWKEAIDKLKKQNHNTDYVEFKDLLNANGESYEILLDLVKFSEANPSFMDNLVTFLEKGKLSDEKEERIITDGEHLSFGKLLSGLFNSYKEIQSYFKDDSRKYLKEKVVNALEKDGKSTSLAKLLMLDNGALPISPLSTVIFFKNFDVSGENISAFFEKDFRWNNQGRFGNFANFKAVNLDEELKELKVIYPNILESKISQNNFLLSFSNIANNEMGSILKFVNNNISKLKIDDDEKFRFVAELEKKSNKSDLGIIRSCYEKLNMGILLKEFQKDLEDNNIEKIRKKFSNTLISSLLRYDRLYVKKTIENNEEKINLRNNDVERNRLEKSINMDLKILGLNIFDFDSQNKGLVDELTTDDRLVNLLLNFIGDKTKNNSFDRESMMNIKMQMENEMFKIDTEMQKSIDHEFLEYAIESIGEEYTYDLIEEIIDENNFSVNKKKIVGQINKILEKEGFLKKKMAENVLSNIRELKDLLRIENENKIWKEINESLRKKLKNAPDIIAKHIDKNIIQINIEDLISSEEIFHALNMKIKNFTKEEKIKLVKELEQDNNENSLFKKHQNKFINNFEMLFHEILLEDIKQGRKTNVESKYIKSFIKNRLELLPEVKIEQIEKNIAHLMERERFHTQEHRGGISIHLMEQVYRNKMDILELERFHNSMDNQFKKDIERYEKEIKKIRGNSPEADFENKNIIRLAILELNESMSLSTDYKDTIAAVIETDKDILTYDYDYMDKYSVIDMSNRTENHWISPLMERLDKKAEELNVTFNPENFFANYIIKTKKFKEREIIYRMSNLNLSKADVFKNLTFKMGQNILSIMDEEMLKEFNLGASSLWKDIEFASVFADSLEKRGSAFDRIIKLLPPDVTEVFKFFKMNSIEDWSASLREVFLSIELDSVKGGVPEKPQRSKKKI